MLFDNRKLSAVTIRIVDPRVSLNASKDDAGTILSILSLGVRGHWTTSCGQISQRRLILHQLLQQDISPLSIKRAEIRREGEKKLGVEVNTHLETPAAFKLNLEKRMKSGDRWKPADHLQRAVKVKYTKTDR